MSSPRESVEVSLVASLARHLAFAPVAFAVTEGPTHLLRYANMAFKQLQDTGQIVIGRAASDSEPTSTNLAPMLDRAFATGETVRDELLSPAEGTARWSCTVWPIAGDGPTSEGLVLEVRDAAFVEGAIARQRAITQRLLLGALREQDSARDAVEAGRRANFLAAASHDLAKSIDQDATRQIVQRSALPRKGTWCIVDIIESNGAIHRLAVIHPDPAKQALADRLADQWFPKPEDPEDVLSIARAGGGKPVIIGPDADADLLAAAHGAENLQILRDLGFGALLVVPLLVRDTVLGTITFVSPAGEDSFSPQDIALASDLADRCAMALENARLYRETDALRASADESNRAKSEFLGNMSHELRAPLNAIGGYVELLNLASRGSLNEEQQADLGRIKHNQEHLTTLISHILNFVRTESGRMEYHFSKVSVEGALKDVAELLDGPVREHQLTLVLRPGDSNIEMWADIDRVRQILVNLVMNALKHGPASGGTVTLSYAATQDSVTMRVADDGPGIPPEKLETIFEPFVQLAIGDKEGGVGLGLAISRDLAHAMKGDLTVESTVGKGARFTLTLPRTNRGDKATG